MSAPAAAALKLHDSVRDSTSHPKALMPLSCRTPPPPPPPLDVRVGGASNEMATKSLQSSAGKRPVAFAGLPCHTAVTGDLIRLDLLAVVEFALLWDLIELSEGSTELLLQLFTSSACDRSSAKSAKVSIAMGWIILLIKHHPMMRLAQSWRYNIQSQKGANPTKKRYAKKT